MQSDGIGSAGLELLLSQNTVETRSNDNAFRYIDGEVPSIAVEKSLTHVNSYPHYSVIRSVGCLIIISAQNEIGDSS